MHDQLVESVKQIISRLGALLLEDPPLRSAVRRFAELVIEKDDTSAAQAPDVELRAAEPFRHGSEQPARPETPPLDKSLGHIDEAPIVVESLAEAISTAELFSGTADDEARSTPVPRAYWAPTTDADLSLIEMRCRLKAEGTRWTIERRRLLAEGAARWEIAPVDQEIISRARNIENCFLWMIRPDWQPPEDKSLVEELASCFETAADGVALVRAIKERPALERELLEPALDLLAEAQSALRAAVSNADFNYDSDQEAIYSWLRQTAQQRQTFIQRHMRLSDPADPKAWADLSSRISEMDARLHSTERRDKEQRRLLNKVRYLVKQIGSEPDLAHAHWQTLDRSVEDLIAQGVSLSNRELREALLPVIDDMPDVESLSPVFAQTLREVDRFLASRLPGEERVTQPARSADVSRVAELLHDQAVVLIGGERRPTAEDALVRAFGLSELIWLSCREHESLDRFKPAVARRDVALVLLAIRWSSHAYGDVKGMCDEHGKPFVRLPGGYNPNQVAAQILSQCGDRLQEAAAAAR